MTRKQTPKETPFNVLRYVSAFGALALGVYVTFFPNVYYAPQPKVILFLIIALLPAILFGAEATSRFQLKFNGFLFTTVGAAALFMGVMFLLNYLAKPEQQIAVFHIIDEKGQPVIGLERDGAVNVALSQQGVTVTKLIDGNNIVLIFPEQVPECKLSVKPVLQGPAYSGLVSYAGNREADLRLGKQLIIEP